MLRELAEVFNFSGRKDADGFLLTILDEMPQCVQVVNENGTLARINDAGVRMIGGDSQSEVEGMSMSSLVAEQDREQWLDNHRQVCAGQKLAWEFHIVGLKGTRRLVETHAVPVKLDDGGVGALSVTRDITDRWVAERALQDANVHLDDLVRERTEQLRETSDKLGEREKDFEILVNSVTDYAIYRLDRQGNVASWNPGAQRIKGYFAEEIVGRNFSEFYTPEDRATNMPHYGLETAAREGRFANEGWRVRKDGSRFWASIVIDAIKDGDDVVGFAKVTRDVTDRKVAEEKLRQAEKLQAIGQMTGGAAHDFNNLLMAIQGSLELLRKRLTLDPKELSLLDNALHGAKRGAALTQRMLAFARKQELKTESVDLPGMVRGVWELIQQSVTSQIIVEASFPPSLARARTDQSQLENALINLVVNARDAMPTGGTIVISGAEREVKSGASEELPSGRYVCLSVADNGEGMDAETLSHVTEPFYTTKGVGRGTGLGLSMVDGLAAQSGGRLAIESAKRQGTAVEIWLPVDASETGSPGTADARPTEESPVRKLRVLAVDDDALVLLNTTAMIEDLGHEPIEATSGKQALAMMEAGEQVDLIVTDQAMPGMTGVELVESVRALKPSIPVVLATGYAELPTKAPQPLTKLSKPFGLDDLADAIKAATGASAAA